jgi:hypothetical protein
MAGKPATPDAPDAAAVTTETPPTDTPPPTPPAEPADAAAPTVRGRYISLSSRKYHFPGAPITPEHGDVCDLPGTELPGDGCWEPTTDAVTRLPDNHPDNQPPLLADQDPALIAHSLGEREEILRGLGLLKDEAEGGEQQ